MSLVKQIILVLVISVLTSASFNSASAGTCKEKEITRDILIVYSLITNTATQSLNEIDKKRALYLVMNNERLRAYIQVMTYFQNRPLLAAAMQNAMVLYMITNNLSLVE